jgi:glycosyltransferase involved in cell wall biosynthesis
MTNVWYVHPYAGGPGVGRYARPYSLAKAWAQEGVRTTVFTAANHHQLDTPKSPGPFEVDGVAYEFLPCRPYSGNGIGRLVNMAEAAIQLRARGNSYAKRYGKPDVIISSSPHPYMFLGAHPLARHFGAKSIFEVRDLWPLSFVELLGVSKRHPMVLFTSWLQKFAYEHANEVVSLLPLTKPYMVEHGMAPAKWHYIPNGVDASGQHNSTPAANAPCINKAAEFAATGAVVVGYTGALGLPNNVESLVHALSTCVHQHHQNVAAVIVGRGDRKAAIEQLVGELRLQDRVAVFDQVPKNVALSLLRAVDIGYISLKEGPLFKFGISPNKLFDYMLAGLPVLSNINAGNDPVQEAGCGISVKSGSREDVAGALGKLVSMGKDGLAQMGGNGVEYVLKEHSYGLLAKRYVGVF